MSGTEAELPPTIVVGEPVNTALPLPPPVAPKPPARVKKFAPAREGGDAWDQDVAAEEAGETVELAIRIPDVRQPRMGATVNGQRIDHLLISGSVTNNAYFEADRFRLVVAMQDSGDFNLRFWADTPSIEVEVFAGFGTSIQPNKSLLMGRVDDLEMDLVSRTVTVNGRDYTADMIETKTTEKWPNKTASEIVTEIAERHGLTPVVTPTSVPSGKYYSQDHTRLTDQSTEWNLVTYLAEQEGMDVYVVGKELHFEPPTAQNVRWTVRYTPSDQGVPPQAGIEFMQIRQNKNITREIRVIVVSHNQKKKKSFRVTRQSNLMGKGFASGLSRSPYVFRIPGLTEEQAIREAEKRLQDISRHLRVVELRLPGHPDITARATLVIEGTGSTYDTEYHIDELVRDMDQDHGFTMRIGAKNVPASDVAAL